jgi:hypothetical protein
MKKKKTTLSFYRTALALLFYINSLKNWSELFLNGWSNKRKSLTLTKITSSGKSHTKDVFIRTLKIFFAKAIC